MATWNNNLRGDLMGGLVASIIALPISLAFGVASGLGPAAGLYGAIACGIIAAISGGTPVMISGPTGPVTVGVAAIAVGHPDRAHLIFAVAIVAGLIQILLGRLKSGQLVLYIPHPVISGFMTGIGIIIIAIQLLPLCGLQSESEIFDILASLVDQAPQVNTDSIYLGLSTVAIIYAVQHLRWKIPPLLVALVAATACSMILNLDLPRIGAIPRSLPALAIPVFHLRDIHIILSGGLTIAILGAMDSLLTAVMIDRVVRTRHDSDRELFGQGLGNIVSGLIGGIPGSGTTMPSIVNIGTGGKTRLSAVACSAILLLVLLGLGEIAAQIPQCVLAGILMTVGISIIDKKSLLAMRSAQKGDIAVMLIVIGLTVFVDLIVAVCFGVALASTLFAKRLADARKSSVGRLVTLKSWQHLTNLLPEELHEHIYIYDFSGPLFFGEVKNFLYATPSLENAECIILRFNDVPFIDQTGAYALEDTIVNWKDLSIRVMYVGIEPGIRKSMENIGFSFSKSNFFDSTEDAVKELASSTT